MAFCLCFFVLFLCVLVLNVDSPVVARCVFFVVGVLREKDAKK